MCIRDRSITEHPPHNLIHVPVLLEATLELLHPMKGENYLDLTAGYGGHASQILNITGNYAESVLVDRDDYAIKRLKPLSTKGVKLLHTDFVTAARQLIKKGQTFSIVLVDLGVSSPQLDQNERGFSFTNSGPLDMRMDQSQELTAEMLVNNASVEELARIITQYGEEPIGFSKKIALAIFFENPIGSSPYWVMIRASSSTEALLTSISAVNSWLWSIRISSGPLFVKENPRSF